MKKPDTVLAKYFFLVFVGLLVFILFSITMWILNLSGRCAAGEEPKEEKKNKNIIISLLLFVLICSFAAQAVNQSYTRIVPSAVNASIKSS